MKSQKIPRLPNYVRMHRIKAGLTQRELGGIVGQIARSSISRHERFLSVPDLGVALRYEAIFKVPVAEIFPGVRDKALAEVNEQLSTLKHALETVDDAHGYRAELIAKKLEWLWRRNEPQED